MFTKITNWIVLLWLLLGNVAAANAQPTTPCAPLLPPSWVHITNVTPTSAIATWEGVAPGAWYRVELKNLNTGIVEDLTVTQALTRTYTGLHPGTLYRVTVQASSCAAGPFGSSNFSDFSTPIVIVDDIVNLNINQKLPNQQGGLGYASTDRETTESQFDICIFKVNSLPPSDILHDVFHGYISLTNSNHFFEFAMVGDLQEKAHFPLSPLRFPYTDWKIEYITPDGQHFFNPPMSLEVLSMNISHQDSPGVWVQKMSISAENMIAQTAVLPLHVTLGTDVQFHYAANHSGLCSGNSNLEAPKGGAVMNFTSLRDRQRVAMAPNPFEDYLELQIPELETRPGTIRIFDATGRLQFEYTGGASADLMSINTADWRSGLYYLQVQTEAGSSIHPMVKL